MIGKRAHDDIRRQLAGDSISIIFRVDFADLDDSRARIPGGDIRDFADFSGGQPHRAGVADAGSFSRLDNVQVKAEENPVSRAGAGN